MNKKEEYGVMVVKNGKGWGNLYNDGHASSDGWVNMCDAEIHNPKYCTKTTDVTYANSPYVAELKTAKLVHVKRITEVIIDE